MNFSYILLVCPAVELPLSLPFLPLLLLLMKTTTPLPGWRSLRQIFPALLLLLPLLVRGQSANIVISQVYGGGGSTSTNPTPAFKQDYVELFNRATTAQTIGGYTLQYGSAAGTGNLDVSMAFPAGTTIPGGGYFLVALGTTATSTGAALPAPDFTPASAATLNLAAGAGKIALVSNSTPLAGTNSASAPTVIDFVGYGGANTYEGTASAAALSTVLAAFRSGDGCNDTNQNSADFTVAAPTPRNASQPLRNCGNQVLVANPAMLTFSAPTGQVASTATYTLAGYNLGGTTAVTISSNNAAVLVSTTGAAGSFGPTASVTTTASGTLSQLITVQFTAPATAGTTTATIGNSDGTRTVTVAVTGVATSAYTWNGSLSNSYNTAGNWTPARTTTNTSDVLIFDGTATPTASVVLDYPAPQTIGQLRFMNTVAATLLVSDTRSLVLAGNLPGDDLVIGAGSTVRVANTAGVATTAALNLSLSSTETAAVSGTLIFMGYAAGTPTTNGQHTLQALSNTTTGAIQFLAGSRFQAAPTYSGVSPFGTVMANAGSAIFRNGARYEQLGGLSPFGSAGSPAAIFEPTSYYFFNATGAPSLTGRTYGTLEISSTSNSATSAGADPLTVQGDLIISGGIVNINLTNSAALQGNVQISNAASLNFGTNSANTAVQLSGTAAQMLSSTSTNTTPITFGANATLQINNAAGVTLGLPITVPGTLQLTNGLLTTTATNSLTLATDATGGSNTSFVNGPVLRPVSATGAYIFPIGKSVSYRPLTLTVSTQSGTTYYRAEQVEGNPGQNVGSSGLTRVSIFRSFTITPFASAAGAAAGMVMQPSNFMGTVTLSFGSNDGVTDPAATTFVVGKRADSNQPWANSSRGLNTASTLTSGAFTTFSEFVLASTDPNPNPNPLPVVLTSFTATRQSSGAVQVGWATASEQHSAYFEVQRSPDGGTFAAIAKVAANGTTTQAHTYASLDQAAPATQLYYRLRQVDTDGTETFSPVVTLGATGAAATLALYPNPAHSQLTIAAAAGQQVQIIDLAGRVLQTTTLPASGNLNVESLPAGTYLLRAPLSGQQRVLRFTKE